MTALPSLTPEIGVTPASGPSLAQFGITGALPDPKLTLLSGNTVVSYNQGWGGSAQIASSASAVGAFPWVASSLDAAILATLQPGSYTAQVSGAVNGTGEALVEVYDTA